MLPSNLRQLASEVVATLEKADSRYGDAYRKAAMGLGNIAEREYRALLIQIFEKAFRLDVLLGQYKEEYATLREESRDLVGWSLLLLALIDAPFVAE